MSVEVQWWGGPEDGAVFKVKDNVRHITVALPPLLSKLDYSAEADYPGQPLEFEERTVTIPILIRHGRAYAVYPKNPPHPKEKKDAPGAQ